MTNEGEQQEAVCGACDGDGTLGSYQGEPLVCSRCNGTGRIPAPVVPSDDECESRYRGQSCHLGRAHGGPHMNLDMGGHEWEDNTIGASAPPTPSQDAESVRSDSDRQQRSLAQDAEGDGRKRVEQALDRLEFDILSGAGLATRTQNREAVESAIRAPYKKLVKALAQWAFARSIGGGYICRDCGHAAEEWSAIEHASGYYDCKFNAAITRIEESLGGRS